MLYDQCHVKIVSRYYKLYTECSFVSRARHFFKSGFNNIARAVKSARFEIDTKTPKVDTDTMAGNFLQKFEWQLPRTATGSLTSLKQRLAPTCSRIETCGKM